MKRPHTKTGSPVPVRFSGDTEKQIDQLAQATGLSKGEIIRRACAAMFPKFLSGEVAVVEVVA